MLEQAIQSQPHEKMMTTLHRSYNQALFLLKKGQFTEGIQNLISILHHPYINDTDLQNLKYSTLVSLAEVHQNQGDLNSALGFFWKGYETMQQHWQQTQKGQANGRQHDQKPGEEFTLILKMIFLMEKMNHPEELIYLLKKAIKLSPLLWRDKLLVKLRSLYEKEQKGQALSDLDFLMQNTSKMEEVLSQKSFRDESNSNQLQAQEYQASLEQVKICINLNQKDEVLLKYGSWQTLFTITYVLLKCQNFRNFNKKKYLHKKFDQNDKDWNQFLKRFSKIKTKIVIQFVESQDQLEKQKSEEPEPNFGKMVADLANQLLKAKYLKKKAKKQNNPLQELTRIPSLSGKDTKKMIVTQTKSIFSSINEYYKELFAKTHFQKEWLNDLRILDEVIFEEIFGEMVKKQPQKMKPEGDQNSDDDNEGSISLGQGLSDGDKEITKEKKSYKIKKMERIANQKKLNSQIKTYFNLNDNVSLEFPNICQMVDGIVQNLLCKSQSCSSKNCILQNSGIRMILEKNILKLMEAGDGFFMNVDSLEFLDMLMEKLEQLTEKDVKSKSFKDYQEKKKQILIKSIKDKFQPTTYQIQSFLEDSLSLEHLRKLSQICFSMVKLYSLYEVGKLQEVSFYRDLFICFKSKEHLKASEVELPKEEVEKKVAAYIDKEIQKYQKKIELKSRILSMNEENEEKSYSVEDIYKKDAQLSAILPLLKVFNCHPDQLKYKPSEMAQQINSKVYLESFIKLSSLFFRKIELESKKQFNTRLVTLLSEIVKIKQIIIFLYDKFMDGVTFKANPSELSVSTCIETVFYLLKYYLFNIAEEADQCLKMSIYLLNSIIRLKFNDNEKYFFVPKLICIFDELIKYRKNRSESYSIRKKFYQHIILKNINYIYQSPLFAVSQEEKEKKGKKMKKKIKGKFDSDDEPSSLQAAEKKQEDHQNIKEKIYDILHNIYFCPEKDREFNPKKIEQAIGYFMYLLRAYHDMFQDQVIELQNEALKVFKKCIKIYSQKKDQVYSYCQKFKDFKKMFYLVMNGQQSKVDKEYFISLIKQEKPICQCCPQLSTSQPFYVESLFVLGKFYEAQFASFDMTYDNREQWQQEADKDEEYYFDYLALNLGKESAWENLIRCETSKTFYYFDSLLNVPFEKFKNRFLMTKKLIHFVIETCPQFKKILSNGSAHLEIMNILKIKERQYMMIQKQIQTVGLDSKEVKELEKKYLEGLKKIASSSASQLNNDLGIKYLRLSQIKFKIIWNNFEKDTKDQQQQSSVIINIDEQSDESRIFHSPTKNILQLQSCIEETKTMIQGITLQTEVSNFTHLEEDIVMETYILLCKHIQKKLSNVLQSLCASISSPDRHKKIKAVQFSLSDLGHTIKLFKHGDFLTSNIKYKLNGDNISINSNDLQNLKTSILKIFVPHEIIKEQKMIEEIVDKPIIIITEDKNEEGNIDLNKSRMSEQSDDKDSKRSRSKSSHKCKTIAKTLIIDLGQYVAETISQYIRKKKFYNTPLNHIQNVLSTPLFQESIIKVGKIFTELCRIVMDLPKYQIKRQKNRRSVVFSLLYCSHLAVTYAKTPRQANELIKDYYSFKSDQFTCLNLYNDKILAEKNELLSNFYNRTIVHNIMKIQFIREIFQIFVDLSLKDNLVLLIKKMLKLSKGRSSKFEKEKSQKEVEEEELKVKKEVKSGREGKQQKNLEQTTFFFLFCEGALKFTEMLQKESFEKEIEQKYEKNLIQFRNRMKKWLGDENNISYQKIQDFITDYQTRFQKKIKLKRARKTKQIIEHQVQQLENNDIEVPLTQIKPIQSQTFKKNEEKSLSVKSHNSNDSLQQKTPLKRKKKIYKKDKEDKEEKIEKKEKKEKKEEKEKKETKQKKEKKSKEKISRVRKTTIKNENIGKKVREERKEEKTLQPIEIKESPEKEEPKAIDQQIKPEKRRVSRIPRVKTEKKH